MTTYFNKLLGCTAVGTICMVSQSQTAFCNRCDFDRTRMRCDSTDMIPSTNDPDTDVSATGKDEQCLTSPTIVYQGFDFRYEGECQESYIQKPTRRVESMLILEGRNLNKTL